MSRGVLYHGPGIRSSYEDREAYLDKLLDFNEHELTEELARLKSFRGEGWSWHLEEAIRYVEDILSAFEHTDEEEGLVDETV